jgi:hypothetical protein
MRDAEREIARAHGDDDFGSEDESVRELEDDEATDEVDLSDPDLPERFVAIAMLLMELQSEGEITKKELDNFFKSPAKDDERYKVKVPPNYTKQRAKLLKFLGETRSHLAADIALFGRMTTSAAFQDVEAACQVADAISTHPTVIEDDYFTAVDDLDTSAGAAYASRTPAQFASAVFYHNLVVDYDALLRNLGAELPKGKEDDKTLQKMAAEARQIAPKTIEGLLRAIMHNVPSGKINSHAHNQQPSLILVEVKDKHLATNYLTAFHDPARNGEREDGSTETLLTDSVQKLLAFARYRDKKMKIEGTKRFLFANDEPTEDAIARLRERLKGGQSSPLTDDEFFINSKLTTCETFEDFVEAINGAVGEGAAK